MGTATEGQSRGGTPASSAGSTTGRGRATGETTTPRRTRPRQHPSAEPGSHPAPRQRSLPRAPRMPFVLLVLGLLGGALVSLLALRTVLIEDAFAISQLQEENRELTDREEALREEVVHMESSEEVSEAAEELGMVPGEETRFLDVETGEVLGEDEAEAR